MSVDQQCINKNGFDFVCGRKQKSLFYYVIVISAIYLYEYFIYNIMYLVVGMYLKIAQCVFIISLDR